MLSDRILGNVRVVTCESKEKMAVPPMIVHENVATYGPVYGTALLMTPGDYAAVVPQSGEEMETVAGVTPVAETVLPQSGVTAVPETVVAPQPPESGCDECCNSCCNACCDDACCDACDDACWCDTCCDRCCDACDDACCNAIYDNPCFVKYCGKPICYTCYDMCCGD